MTRFQEKISNKLRSLNHEGLNHEEDAVMSILLPTFDSGKVTQRDIEKTEKWLGCHPQHEADIVANVMDTTLRQVRQIINNLRIEHKVPIISDRNGYWICRTEREARDYLQRLEIQVKATTKAYFETYRAMQNTLDINNEYLEKLNPQGQESLLL